MWIVKVALGRPYTFIVLAILLVVMGGLTALRTPVDIFPNIGIPVVSVVWSYSGLPPDEMADRVVSNYERSLTTTVNDIEHIESQSLNGVSVVKIFFHPTVNVDLAVSQVTAISQASLRQMPPGMTPPLVLQYSASSVPIIQLALSSPKLSEQQIFDLGMNFIRSQLATVQGASITYPYGGKSRQIQVDLDQQQLRAHGLSADDVNNAINNQNLIIPAGTEKIGDYEYNIRLNASPNLVAELNNLPVKMQGSNLLYVRDVAHVRDGFAPQTNIVRVDGQRSVLLTIQKTGATSTLDIISRIKQRLPFVRQLVPPELKLAPIGDQSIFVSAAIAGVVREAVIAAGLTGLMILLFLGSWRSTLIVTLSIPLAVLASIIALSALGETINLMTLGGLALAVGILVDDATVTIENINWHLEQGKPLEAAILDGAQQIATPALVSTLCICIVFVPMFLLAGVARYLFVPLAEAVVFAVLASYVLSRTLVPTLAKYWLKAHDPHAGAGGILARFQQRFERGFERLRAAYLRALASLLARRRLALGGLAVLILCTAPLTLELGQDFFPSVDAGQLKLHIRARVGTRIEETARLSDQVEDAIRQTIPKAELVNIVDNIGLPISGINLSYSNSAPIGSSDADVLITLAEQHKPAADYMRELRRVLPERFPGVSFAFLPADIVGQILNFGQPAPIDIQVSGFNLQNDRHYAEELMAKLRAIPGIADLRTQQAFDQPELDVTVDRGRAAELGLTQHDVATNLLVGLSGSFQTTPNFWDNKANGVQYSLVTQIPQYGIDTPQDLVNVPLGQAGNAQQILGSLSTVTRSAGPAVVSHYNVAPMVDIFAAVQDTDLGSVATQIQKVLDETHKDLPRGTQVFLRGQVETMHSSFTGLFEGLVLAILLIYMLIVINFQSWLDPFIIICALPAALCGIVWGLFVTGTTLSVPALMGAIMCIGVATANSILIVSFAREKMAEGLTAAQAVLEAGTTRFRPVLMTALAMIIGMVPMALGLGDGGEQNAPLGRAVVGGLIFATIGTLFLVPTIFDLFHSHIAARAERKRALVSPEALS
jgi:CzcA family heavy metal efflux pump